LPGRRRRVLPKSWGCCRNPRLRMMPMRLSRRWPGWLRGIPRPRSPPGGRAPWWPSDGDVAVFRSRACCAPFN